MSAILIVFKKEMVDHLRDGRSILVSMIYPLLGPLLLGLMFFFVGGSMRVNEDVPLVVPIVNAASAPDLVRFLESGGARMQYLPDGARILVMGGRLAFALELPPQSGTAPQGPLPVRLITNPSRFDSIVATGRIIEQRMAVPGWLDGQHVKPRPCNQALIERLNQRGLIDQPAAGRGKVCLPGLVLVAGQPVRIAADDEQVGRAGARGRLKDSRGQRRG
jgi:hypothetical protein